MPPPARRFSFFGLNYTTSAASSGADNVETPQLKLEADKEVYRPGDLVTVTIEIKNVSSSWSLLIKNLNFEIKGIEKLDTQWFTTPKPGSDSRQRRGEYVFLDSSSPTIVTNQILSSGATRTYVVRTLLPNFIPPSYRGATIRYLYFVRISLSGQYLVSENVTSRGESRQEVPELEERLPLQIWVTQKCNGITNEEDQADVQGRDSYDSRPHGASNSSTWRNRNGSDRQPGRGASKSPMHGKPTSKKENGSTPYKNNFSSAAGASVNNRSQGPSGISDGSVTESKGLVLGTTDYMPSAVKTASVYQSTRAGIPGQVSMADIVRMGKPHNKASHAPSASHHNIEDTATTEPFPYLRSPSDHASKVTQPEVSSVQRYYDHIVPSK